MKQNLEEEAELRKYLLGELTWEERVSVEARLFLDDEYSSQLLAVEDELIEAYDDDDLAAPERAKVESRILSKPGRREDLSITRAIKRYVPDDDPIMPPAVPAPAEPPPRADAEHVSAPDAPTTPRGKGPFSFLSSLFTRRPVVAYALAAAALVVISVFTWLSMESPRGGGQPPEMRADEPTPQQSRPDEPAPPGRELQANRQTPGPGGAAPRREERTRNGQAREGKEERAGRRDETTNENAPPAPRTTQATTFVILPGGVVRGPGGAKKVTLSSEIGVVFLRLPVVVKGDYQRFRATLQDGRRVIYTWADLKPEVDEKWGKVVALKAPAQLLRARRYEIKLGGVTADGHTRGVISYTVPVERR